MSTKVVISVLLALGFSSSPVFAGGPGAGTAAPGVAVKPGRVFFIEPKDKSVVGQDVHVKMGVEGRAICPAGPETADKTCGHHHILIDQGFVPEGQVIAKNETHHHYGKGETEAHIKLTPGKHKLTLQFGDFAHRSYGEKLSQTIEVTVK